MYTFTQTKAIILSHYTSKHMAQLKSIMEPYRESSHVTSQFPYESQQPVLVSHMLVILLI